MSKRALLLLSNCVCVCDPYDSKKLILRERFVYMVSQKWTNPQTVAVKKTVLLSDWRQQSTAVEGVTIRIVRSVLSWMNERARIEYMYKLVTVFSTRSVFRIWLDALFLKTYSSVIKLHWNYLTSLCNSLSSTEYGVHHSVSAKCYILSRSRSVSYSLTSTETKSLTWHPVV